MERQKRLASKGIQQQDRVQSPPKSPNNLPSPPVGSPGRRLGGSPGGRVRKGKKVKRGKMHWGYDARYDDEEEDESKAEDKLPPIGNAVKKRDRKVCAASITCMHAVYIWLLSHPVPSKDHLYLPAPRQAGLHLHTHTRPNPLPP